ncbi:hypothetical protein [Methylococcus sp. EFPC2]|uniref:hypothetical protein n=1 Tax=Methylococcus sp. EFPC2 TaxID=2812648 RepID=UPI0019687953|nr:hypothetical protein [Methylococcus sp. EFPC2]QSA95630.1 hypothetical protein JWZ97_10225 [Methylococcus sp. EFPC2]
MINKYFRSTIHVALAVACVAASSAPVHANDEIRFPLVRPATLGAACAPDAKGYVRVRTQGNVEVMDVRIEGLPPRVEFDAFVIQVPHAPFGLSWYQGDLQTNRVGKGYGHFLGRFNEETFIVAPNVAPAPHVHNDPPFPDAAESPKTAPVHTYHVGIWFNSPEDAVAAGCPDNVTPFNGEHRAGIQILNTSNYPDLQGPLLRLKP